MERIKGKLNFIGKGSVTNLNKTYSVLEIGNHSIRNISVSKYLDSYLEIGNDVEVIIYKGLFTKAIAGIRINNKVYKWPTGTLIVGPILKTLLVSPLLFLLPYMLIMPMTDSATYLTIAIGIALTAIYFMLKIRHISDLAKF